MKRKDFKITTKNNFYNVILNFLGNLFFTYCMIIAFALIVFSNATVECEVIGPSMVPTLNNLSKNDYVYVNIYNHKYSYNDIVVCDTGSEQIIKRIVGMPLDSIDIVKVKGEYKLERNGKIIDEDYILFNNDPRLTIEQKNGMFNTNSAFQQLKVERPELFKNGKLIVPNNTIFVLGDNRAVSCDSSMYGPFEFSKVKGVVEQIKYANESQFSFYFEYVIEGKFFRTIANMY